VVALSATDSKALARPVEEPSTASIADIGRIERMDQNPACEAQPNNHWTRNTRLRTGQRCAVATFGKETSRFAQLGGLIGLPY